MSVAMIGPKFYGWGRDGKPLAFGKLYTYQAKTNTPKPTYQSEDQAVENSNPVTLNGEGYANVYLSGAYKMVLKDSDENEIWSSDPVSSPDNGSGLNYVVTAYYVSPLSFKALGNHVASLAKGGVVALRDSSGNTIEATIVESSFVNDFTTVLIQDGTVSADVVQASSSNGVGAVVALVEEGETILASLSGNHVGAYNTDPTLETLNDYTTFNDKQYKVKVGGVVPHTIDSATFPDPNSDTNLILYSDLNTINGDQRYIKQLDIQPPIQGERDVRMQVIYGEASFRYGLSDAVPLDDPRNNFRGLPSQDSWGEPANRGNGTTSFGRNGASYAYLGTTVGHDAITYGVASFAGGAGTATGNPDDPNDATDPSPVGYGYCSFGYGKDSISLGRVSHALGERCDSMSEHSSTQGIECVAGPGLASHPNGDIPTGSGIVSPGNAAAARGSRCQAYGDYAVAQGRALFAYNGAQVYGSGINTGSPLINSTPNSIAFGRFVDVSTFKIFAGPGVNGAFGKFGFNTDVEPDDRGEINVIPGDTISIISNDSSTTPVKVRLGGKIGGVNRGIFEIEYTNPNAGQPFGVTNLLQNETVFSTIAEDGAVNFTKALGNNIGYDVGGIRVVGGQQGAIADAVGGTEIARINDILAVLRRHGLIAT